MPLSPPDARKKIHTRQITCQAFQREDGLWDIEGHIEDVKTYNFANRDRGGEIKAGEPLHGMWLRLTIDESLVIHKSEAVTDYSPFNVCPQIADNYASLKGLKIGSGWKRKVHERVGGVQGCTHLTDLLSPIATTAIQAIKSGSRKKTSSTQEKTAKPKSADQAKILNRCYALSEDGEVVRDFFPKLYKPSQD